MQHSINCLNMVAEFEGLRLEAYKDIRGILTIGYGHIQGVYEGQVITKAQALLFLNADLIWADTFISNNIKEPLNQNQFDALVSFVYNIGVGNFKKSSCFTALNENKFSDAANDILLWNKVNGVVSSGLDRRRHVEHDLFLKPI
jgi:lysozyme